MREDFRGNSAKTMDEYHKRKVKNIPDALKDGEQQLVVLPAFDFRGTDDSQYGQHGATLSFSKRRGHNGVTVEFYTGWSVDNVPTTFNGKNMGLMCTGLYRHYGLKKDAGEYAYHHDGCPYTGRKRGCYGEAMSALYGDVLLDKLINYGSVAIWEEIEQELDNMEDK